MTRSSNSVFHVEDNCVSCIKNQELFVKSFENKDIFKIDIPPIYNCFAAENSMILFCFLGEIYHVSLDFRRYALHLDPRILRRMHNHETGFPEMRCINIKSFIAKSLGVPNNKIVQRAYGYNDGYVMFRSKNKFTSFDILDFQNPLRNSFYQSDVINLTADIVDEGIVNIKKHYELYILHTRRAIYSISHGTIIKSLEFLECDEPKQSHNSKSELTILTKKGFLYRVTIGHLDEINIVQIEVPESVLITKIARTKKVSFISSDKKHYLLSHNSERLVINKSLSDHSVEDVYSITDTANNGFYDGTFAICEGQEFLIAFNNNNFLIKRKVIEGKRIKDVMFDRLGIYFVTDSDELIHYFYTQRGLSNHIDIMISNVITESFKDVANSEYKLLYISSHKEFLGGPRRLNVFDRVNPLH